MYKQHKWHFLWLKYDIELKKQVYDQNNFWINFVKKLNLEKNKFKKQKKNYKFFFETRTPDTPWHWQEIFWLCDMAQIFLSSVTGFKYFLAVWQASGNLSLGRRDRKTLENSEILTEVNRVYDSESI